MRLVAALGGADRPRAADVVRGRFERVVRGPCGVLAADRVDRRQVQHVEAQSARRRASRASQSRSVPCAPGGSGEVERGKSSYHARSVARSRSTTSGISTGQAVARLRSEGAPRPRASSSSSARARNAAASAAGDRASGRRAQSFRRARSSLPRDAARLARSARRRFAPRTQVIVDRAARELGAPRQQRVDPGDDRVAIAADPRSTRERPRASGRCRAVPSRPRASRRPSSRRQRRRITRAARRVRR